jgi:hypothetical protein
MEKSVLRYQIYQNLSKDTTIFLIVPSMQRRVFPIGSFPLARIHRTAQQCGVGSCRTVSVSNSGVISDPAIEELPTRMFHRWQWAAPIYNDIKVSDVVCVLEHKISHNHLDIAQQKAR